MLCSHCHASIKSHDFISKWEWRRCHRHTHYTRNLTFFFFFFLKILFQLEIWVKYIFECVGPISESIVVYMVLASIKDALQTWRVVGLLLSCLLWWPPTAALCCQCCWLLISRHRLLSVHLKRSVFHPLVITSTCPNWLKTVKWMHA